MSRYSKKYQKGFTLTEVLVSLGIVVSILSVIVLNQSKYVDGAALGNLADEISLTISQAQSYGIAVRELTPGSSDFSASYGISASLLPGNGGSGSSYIFFADRNANLAYDGDWTCPVGGASECLQRVDMQYGNILDSICVVRTNDADQCNSVLRVDIIFVRPDTAAVLTFYNNSGQLYSPPNLKGVRVNLKSPGNATKSVVVYLSGQISVQ